MKLTEEVMRVLGAGIPKLAQGAFRRAHYEALSRNGKVVRALPGPVKFTLGAKFKLKRRVTTAE